MAAKIQIPEALKADLPQTAWGKLLAATPIIMTVVATALAGLASSEMTRAQYDRALAAQQQSKAGDQWGYFQAKKMRSALQRNTLDLLQATADVQPLDAAKLPATLSSETLVAMQKGDLPKFAAAPIADVNVKAALDAIASSKPETEIASRLKPVTAQALAEALTTAKEQVDALDATLKPVNQAVDQLDKSLTGADRALRRDFTAAKLRYTSARYDTEARLNQTIANVLELQVRQNNLTAERHHQRSGKFFYGMLASQAAVIISTFAMAARKRNLLWTIAAAAGLAAIAFAVYVYLRV